MYRGGWRPTIRAGGGSSRGRSPAVKQKRHQANLSKSLRDNNSSQRMICRVSIKLLDSETETVRYTCQTQSRTPFTRSKQFVLTRKQFPSPRNSLSTSLELNIESAEDTKHHWRIHNSQGRDKLSGVASHAAELSTGHLNASELKEAVKL